MLPCAVVGYEQAFESTVSAARLRRYRVATGDDETAWELYRWNIATAAAFLPLICDLEVVLRNTVHGQLAAYFGRQDWWANSDLILDDATTRTLASVLRRYGKKLANGTVGHGKVIA